MNDFESEGQPDPVSTAPVNFIHDALYPTARAALGAAPDAPCRMPAVPEYEYVLAAGYFEACGDTLDGTHGYYDLGYMPISEIENIENERLRRVTKIHYDALLENIARGFSGRS